MYQQVAGKWLEVVDFDTMPELPITGLTTEEQVYKDLVTFGSRPEGILGTLASLGNKITYAQALTHAIENEVITEPGKYGIELLPGDSYVIHKIIEE